MSIIDNAKSVITSAISSALFDNNPLEYGNQNSAYILGIYPNNNKKDPVYTYLPNSINFKFGSNYETVLQKMADTVEGKIDSLNFGNSKAGTVANWVVKGYRGLKSSGQNAATFQGAAISVKEYIKNYISWNGANRLTLSLPVFLISWSEEETALKQFSMLSEMSVPEVVSSENGNVHVVGSSYLNIPGPYYSAATADNILSLSKAVVSGGQFSSELAIKKSVITDRCFTLSIGEYARIPDMILKDVSGDIKSLFTAKGYPLLVGVTLSFESIFPMTAGDIREIFDVSNNKAKLALDARGRAKNNLNKTKAIFGGLL